MMPDLQEVHEFVGGGYAADLDTNCGDLYQVQFDDGSTRRMRNLRKHMRIDHIWVETTTGRIVTQAWLVCRGKPLPRSTFFKNPNGSQAFDGARVHSLQKLSNTAESVV